MGDFSGHISFRNINTAKGKGIDLTVKESSTGFIGYAQGILGYDEVTLENLTVEPPHARGNGIGKFVLGEYALKVKEMGYEYLVIPAASSRTFHIARLLFQDSVKAYAEDGSPILDQFSQNEGLSSLHTIELMGTNSSVFIEISLLR
jgi:hypothetical protein